MIINKKGLPGMLVIYKFLKLDSKVLSKARTKSSVLTWHL